MIEAVLWLVINLYHEGRGEPVEAQIAVVHAVLNRAGWEIKNVSGVIQEREQFSWANDRRKLAVARQLVREKRIPEEMKNLVRIVYRAINTPRHKRPVWTYYKANTARSTWGCWPGGVTTTTFSGSSHVFCAGKDVVKPGAIPAYIGRRKLRRKAWTNRELKQPGGC